MLCVNNFFLLLLVRTHRLQFVTNECESTTFFHTQAGTSPAGNTHKNTEKHGWDKAPGDHGIGGPITSANSQ